MKRMVLLACGLLAASRPGWAADEAQSVFARVAPAVVTVRVLDAAGQDEGHGSGVLVAPAQVATNCHVVERAATLRVVQGAQDLAAEWTRRLPGLDLCLLSVPGLAGTPLVLRPSRTLVAGEPVFAVGNPLGFGLAASSGLVAALQPREPYPALVATAPVSPGSSGGGLFDGEGRLLGVTTAIMGTGQNLNLVLVAEAVADLLAKGEARPTPPAPPAAERQWLEEAQALTNARDWDRLVPQLQAWRSAQPNSAWPSLMQAHMQARQNRHAEAESSVRQALAADPHLASAWLELARVLHAQGRAPEAEQALQQGALRDPVRAELHWERSDWLLKQGQREQSIVQMRESLRKDPSNASWWTTLGRLETELGRHREAAQAIAAALRLGGARVQADAVADPEARADPGRADRVQSEALQAQGWNEHRSKRHGPAEVAFRKAIALTPDASSAWNGLGGVLTSLGRMDAAEEALSKALALEPGDAVVLANRAELYRQMDKPELALADVQAALQAKPDLQAALHTQGVLLREAKRFGESGAAFARLSALRPLDSEELATWGDSLFGAGDLEGALVRLRQAEVHPQPSPFLNLIMAKLLAANKDRPGGLVYIEKALALDPTNSVAWSSKGYMLMYMGRLPEAVPALETAVRLDPRLSNGWINLGEAQMRSGNLGRAIEVLNKAIVLAPRALDARYFLARSYLNAGMMDKARDHTQEVLAQQPNMPVALELMAVSYLIDKRVADASAWYLKLRPLAPELARRMRSQAISGGVSAALDWPE